MYAVVTSNARKELTLRLYEYLVGSGSRDVHILGIDLDNDLVQRARQSNPFPNAVQYMCLDVTDPECQPALRRYLQNFHQANFDITFCFSVTMWIHLNHGDHGLKKFLEMMSKNTDFFLLEAQTWKCYRNASRRMRRGKKGEFQNLDSLCMNVNVVDNINDYLEGRCHMNVIQCFGITEWGRKVTLHRKQCSFS